MAPHSQLTREIDDGPAGPQVAALFDLDRTLLAGFSAGAFVRDSIVNGRFGPRELVQPFLDAARFRLGRLGFSGLLTGTARLYRGLPESLLEEIGERVFTGELAAAVYPEARALVAAHRRKGHTLAVVSSATRYQIEPLARDLGIPHVLCTHLAVEDGRFTGDIVRPTCYGEGKLLAAQALAAARGLDLGQSYFYTDSHEDLPLLEFVGHPRPTNPDRRLAALAAARGWPARTFYTRGTPRAVDVVRTTLAAWSLVPSLLFSLPIAALDGGWRRAINFAGTMWGELGTALADVTVRVDGEEHLWSHRPAVFIFNHQSAIDVLLLCRLLRRDFIGISKQEVRKNPLFGPAFALAGTVFIDRFNPEKAIEALRPAVDALRQGLSIAVAPEGTRSVTPRIGRFKKGAFHLAMAAGVPIVPIVFRNALDALPKNGLVIRPATIEAVVLPPIPTDDWKPGELADRVAAIERLYGEVLSA